jgi:hypothetical protein
MKVLKIVTILFFLIFFVVLFFVFVRFYKNLSYAKKYVNFVTDSSNTLIGQFDQINDDLNRFQYSENEQDLQSFVKDEKTFKELIVSIKDEKDGYKIPYGAEEIDEAFVALIEESERVDEVMGELTDSVEKLERSDTFQVKLNNYITQSGNLENKASTLQEKLDVYVNEFTKLDFKKLLHES